MSSTYTSNDLVNAIAAASKNLSARKDEVNRLNVFPRCPMATPARTCR